MGKPIASGTRKKLCNLGLHSDMSGPLDEVIESLQSTKEYYMQEWDNLIIEAEDTNVYGYGGYTGETEVELNLYGIKK